MLTCHVDLRIIVGFTRQTLSKVESEGWSSLFEREDNVVEQVDEENEGSGVEDESVQQSVDEEQRRNKETMAALTEKYANFIDRGMCFCLVKNFFGVFFCFFGPLFKWYCAPTFFFSAH